MSRVALRERDANSFLTKIQTIFLLSFEKSRKAFSLLFTRTRLLRITSTKRGFEIVRRHSRHDSRRPARISGSINHNYVNSGPGTACVRACVPLTCAKSVRKYVYTGNMCCVCVCGCARAQKHKRTIYLLCDKNTTALLSCRRVRNGWIKSLRVISTVYIQKDS